MIKSGYECPAKTDKHDRRGIGIKQDIFLCFLYYVWPMIIIFKDEIHMYINDRPEGLSENIPLHVECEFVNYIPKFNYINIFQMQGNWLY